jgi:predicted membrane-bound mannosyltransferase
MPAFVALWAMGMLAAYSLVPYKTPWLGLNVVLPLALLSGLALEWLGGRSRPLALGVAALALGFSGWQAVTLSFDRYDDDRLPYVYAHTRRGFLDLVRDLEAVAATSGHERMLPVTVTTPEHWPLPWYLRDYPQAGYYGKIPEPVSGVAVIGAVSQIGNLMKTLGPGYEMRGRYPLRPGVGLALFVKSEASGTSAPGGAEP